MATWRLRWDDCYNVRDLGGHATADGGPTRWHAIGRADNLCRLTPAGRAALLEYGVRTIIDLRRADELAIDPSPFASAEPRRDLLTYWNLPLGVGASEEERAAVRATTTGDRGERGRSCRPSRPRDDGDDARRT